jgi:hypothetical protein
MVTTPRLGEASFAGDNGEVVRQGSGLGTKFEPERKELGLGFALGIYTTPGRASSRLRSRRGRQRRDEAEHGVVLSTMRGGEDEDGHLLLFFCRRGKLAGLAATWAMVLGCQGGLMLGCVAR